MNRWFAGTKHIDEVEALCVELLKRLFKSNYAEHRLVASMIGNMAVYAALTEPGDTVMTIPQPVGGHSSNRVDGPAGIRGLNIVDIPFNAQELEVDLDAFAEVARAHRPKLVALGASMTLFPLPVREIAEIVSEWDGIVYFDGAHQLGLIAGGQFQDPLREGAHIITGSAGKTFSGPQSGVAVWNDPKLTKPLLDAVFPALAATHQVNRVAALAAAAAELLAFGPEYMAAIVANAQALAARAGPARRARPRRPQGLHAHAPGDRRRARVRRRPGGRAPARQGEHHHQQEPAARTTRRRTGTARPACASAPPRSPASAWARWRCRRSPT